MEKFILAFRDFKSRPKSLKSKFVWNAPSSRWIVVSFFSNKHIESRGMEVMYGG